MAAVIGATVGAGWVGVLSVGRSPGWSLTSPWHAIMWASCPAIGVIETAWWLVPILNSLLYAVIALLILFFCKFIRPFAK